MSYPAPSAHSGSIDSRLFIGDLHMPDIHQERPALITEAKTYTFNSTCCGCYEDHQEAVLSPTSLSIARRLGCSCCTTSDMTVINLKKVESARVSHPMSCGGLFLGWFFFGCLGWHRFCIGRTRTGFIMLAIMIIALVTTSVGFVFMEEYDSGNDRYRQNPYWLALGVISAFVIAFVVISWVIDAFYLRGWSQYVSFPHSCTPNGAKQKNSFAFPDLNDL